MLQIGHDGVEPLDRLLDIVVKPILVEQFADRTLAVLHLADQRLHLTRDGVHAVIQFFVLVNLAEVAMADLRRS